MIARAFFPTMLAGARVVRLVDRETAFIVREDPVVPSAHGAMLGDENAYVNSQ